MEQRIIAPSELIINSDGSIFHLHIRPDQIADTVILVGDPDRVPLVAKHFDTIECDVQSREFHTITGTLRGRRISCVSHGIGCDNIDIVVTELDALVNIDFATRQIKEEHTTLTLVRIGTSGGLQDICPIGSYVASEMSMGFDGLLNYYETPTDFFCTDIERAFMAHTNWDSRLTTPYVVRADRYLLSKIAPDMVRGITISAPGFYGPQGRYVRIRPKQMDLNERIMSFRYGDKCITNFEMESSALAGMGALLGHKALTVCAIIAGRVSKNMNTNYKGTIEGLITTVLERIF